MRRTFKALLSIMLVLAMCVSLVPGIALAEGETEAATPQVGKTVVANKDSNGNPDGTYTISLSITGDADENTTVKKTNVIFILDASDSMYTNDVAGTGTLTYTATNSNADNLYGTIDEGATYIPLTRYTFGGGPGGGQQQNVYTYDGDEDYAYVATTRTYNQNNVQYGTNDEGATYTELNHTGGGNGGTWYLGGTVYNGTRYLRFDGTLYDGTRYIQTSDDLNRMQATLDAMEGVAQTLLAKNSVAGNDSDTIEVALIAFAENAEVAVQPTTSFDTFKGTSGGNTANCAEYYRADTNIHNFHGTNWDAALQAVDDINFNDNDQTFVVFFTDGQPTRYVGETTTGYTYVQQSYEAALVPAKHIVDPVTEGQNSGLGYTLFSIFAFGDNGGNFETASAYLKQLTNYAYTGTANTNDSDYFYSATGSAALQEAFNSIMEKIEIAGIAEAEMGDGVSVKDASTSEKLIDLVEVIPNTFKYYRSGGNYGTDTPGTEWTNIPNDCKAKVENGEVVWDLAKATDTGVLEDGVTYTLTFECATSQDALDLIAELKNGTKELEDTDGDSSNDVPAAIAKYISKTGDNDYSMLTNSELKVSYKDTRVGNTPIEYEPEIELGPVPINAEPISIEKTWVGNYTGESDAGTLTVGILMDGEESDSFSLTRSGNKHVGERYISTGVMTVKDGVVNVAVAGHDFELTEKVEDSSLTYHWELDSDVMHPMLKNGTIVMLVKVEDENEVPDGVTTTATVSSNGVAYYKIGENFYKENSGSAALTAINYRRSNFFFTKVVEGTDVPADAVFPVTFNFVNSQAPKTEPSAQEDPDHESDWWVWFSVRDKDSNKINEGVTGATSAGDGYWYAPSNSDVTIPVKAGYSIRVGNLPTGTTYTITEGELEEGFNFVKSELSINSQLEDVKDPEDADSTFDGDQITTGTIECTNTDYTVTYTNKYAMSTVKVVKTFTGIPEDQVPANFIAKVTYEVAENAPEGTTKPADVELTILASADEGDESGNDNEGGSNQQPTENVDGDGEGDGNATTTNAIVPVITNNGLTYTWTIERVPVGLNVTVTEDGADTLDNYTLIPASAETSASVVTASSTAPTAEGQTTTLNLTNNYKVATGTLVVVKEFKGDIIEDDVPTITITATDGTNSYTFKTNDTTGLVISENGLTYTWTKEEVPVGTYTVTESDASVKGYSLVTTYSPVAETTGDDSGTTPANNAKAEDGGDAAATEATVTVTKDASVTATITNTYTAKPGELTVIKKFVGITKQEVPALSISVKGTETYTLTTSDETGLKISEDGLTYTWTKEVAADTYVITESGETLTDYNVETTYKPETPAGEGVDPDTYVATSATVTIAKGGKEKAEITNTYTAKPGTLTVIKEFTGDITKNELPDVTITATGKTTYTLAMDDDPDVLEVSENGLTYTWTLEVVADTYVITESGQTLTDFNVKTTYDPKTPAGEGVDPDTYVATSATVTIARGGTETATITNEYTAKPGTLTVIKEFKGDITKDKLPEELSITVTGTETYTLKTTDKEEDGLTVSEDGLTFTWVKEVAADTYVITESDASVKGYDIKTTYKPETPAGEGVDPDTYVATSATVTIARGGKETATITNEYTAKPGYLTVIKTFAGDLPEDKIPTGLTITAKGDTGKTYTLTIPKDGADPDEGVEFKQDGMELTWTVEVKPGVYTVTESGATVSGYKLETEYAPTELPEEQDLAAIEAVKKAKADTKEKATAAVFEILAEGDGEVTITNTYTKNDTPTPPPELDYVDHYGYMVGYPDGTVRPAGNITRAEVATIFFRLLTDESREALWCTTNPFSDVNSTDWFNNAISTMYNAGIVSGYPDGTFRPNAKITRAELATIVARFLEDRISAGIEISLSDISGHWAEGFIIEVAENGIITGYPDGTFKPDQAITRAETVTMINRLLQRKPDKDHMLDNMIVWPDNQDTEAWYYEAIQEATNSHEYYFSNYFESEIWETLLPMRDWAALEKEWADWNSGTQVPGDVMPNAPQLNP